MPSFLGMDLRGHLDLLLLATLHKTGPAHGYAIIAALRGDSSGTFDLPEGTVYPALHRLERSGDVASDWNSTSGRRRRVYQLTPAGAAALRAKQSEWRMFVRSVALVIGRPALVIGQPALGVAG
jgi:PadR family transcriptional regulator, regulatory protein PadR